MVLRCRRPVSCDSQIKTSQHDCREPDRTLTSSMATDVRRGFLVASVCVNHNDVRIVVEPELVQGASHLLHLGFREAKDHLDCFFGLPLISASRSTAPRAALPGDRAGAEFPD